MRLRPRLIDTLLTRFVTSNGNVPEPRVFVPSMPSVALPKIKGLISKAVSLSKSTKTRNVGAGIKLPYFAKSILCLSFGTYIEHLLCIQPNPQQMLRYPQHLH